jgi:hypothetical protein
MVALATRITTALATAEGSILHSTLNEAASGAEKMAGSLLGHEGRKDKRMFKPIQELFWALMVVSLGKTHPCFSTSSIIRSTWASVKRCIRLLASVVMSGCSDALDKRWT